VATFQTLLNRFFYRPDEEVGEFLELAPEVEAPSTLLVEQPEEFLAFSLSGETYVVPIAAVREILKVPQITEVPRAAPNVLGLINVRGEMLPLYDVKPRLRLAAAPVKLRVPGDVPRASRVVLLKDPEGDAGVLVDRVEGVVKLVLSKLEPPPTPSRERDSIAGLGRRGDALYILLDVEQALA
jgi:purine-binding chemotaxis protein CheW